MEKVYHNNNQPSSPTSKSWKRHKREWRGVLPTTFCCVEGCCSNALDRRNFTCLKGNWKKKINHPHRRICSYHYQADLKQFPRKKRKRKDETKKRTTTRDAQNKNMNNTEVSKKNRPQRKRRKVYYDPRDFMMQERKVEHCCLKGCKKIADNYFYKYLKHDKPKLQPGLTISGNLKVCDYHYNKDLDAHQKEQKSLAKFYNEKSYLTLPRQEDDIFTSLLLGFLVLGNPDDFLATLKEIPNFGEK